MRTLILFLLILHLGLPAMSQNCPHFNRLMHAAETYWRNGQFEKALNQLAAAREHCPSESKEIDKKLLAFTQDIARKYEEARQQKRLADEKTREAFVEKERADSTATAAQRAARRAYSNDLVYKSKIALERGDRTTAYRLAEFAYRYVDNENFNVTRALVEALYYNDNPTHSPLPWASNHEGHTSSVNNVAFSPDGKRLATGSSDKTAKIWDVETGQVLRTMEGHLDNVSSVAFSPDGKRLATGSDDKTAKIWDVETGEVLLRLENHSEVGFSSVAFSPDGKRLATGSYSNIVKIWNLETRQTVLALEANSWENVISVAFSLDGKRLMVNTDREIFRIWDLETDTITLKLEGNLSNHVRNAAISPDEKWLALSSGPDSDTVKIWNLKTNEVQWYLKASKIRGIAFSPDTKRLATGSADRIIKIWDLETGNEPLSFEGHADGIYSIAFSPDGKCLATGSGDKTAKLWDLEVGKETLTLNDHKDLIWNTAFSRNGGLLATGSADSTAKIWDVKTGKELLTLQGHSDKVISVAFYLDGKRLATGSYDTTAKIWDLETGQVLLTLEGHSGKVISVAFSPDGKRLATGSYDTTAKIWDLETGKIQWTLEGHSDLVASVAFSPDGKRLATGSYDNTAKIWDLETGKVQWTMGGHSGDVSSVAFSSDGKRLATGSFDTTAKIWDLTEKNDVLTLGGYEALVDPTGEVLTVAFSPDGKRLATGSSDKTAKIWDLETGQVPLTLEGHLDNVSSVAFSPDGKRLVTGSHDNTAKIWDLTPRSINVAEGKDNLADLILPQLVKYRLEDLLDQQPGNEDQLVATEKISQITAFAELHERQTRRSIEPERTSRHYAHAARLYREAGNISGDSTLVFRLGSLYKNWAIDILESGRPDTAVFYIDLACRLLNDKSFCTYLWRNFSETTGRPFDFNRFFSSENPGELSVYGDLFFSEEKWDEARLLYEKAEGKKHNTWVLRNLFLISEKTGRPFDFNRFFSSENHEELHVYGDLFFFEEKWDEARLLYEKAEGKKHNAQVLLKLFLISEKVGQQSFDWERLYQVADSEELGSFAQGLTEEAQKLKNYKDRIPLYQNALRLRERQLNFDTTAALRIIVANEYNNLGYFQLFVPDGAGAEQSFRRSLDLNPKYKYPYANLPVVLLLKGKTDEAKAYYLAWADKRFGGWNMDTYRDAFLADLDELEKEKVPGINYELVRGWLR
ncbi:MAG: Protein TolB [Haliscomenobacter sp.]|jgi:WD40 repeat protein|nr:Protein TolB [Haliscomenobacter sp.]